MNINHEKQLEILRHAIRGTRAFHKNDEIWTTSYASSFFGLAPHLKNHPEDRKKSDSKRNLGFDRLENSLKDEFNSSKNTDETPTKRFARSLFAPAPDYIPELDPKFHEFIYCRPEVTLALSVVALENGMPPKMLRGVFPEVRNTLKNETEVATMQNRFPDITDKRIKKACKALKL